jgi:copper resistance protein B
VRREFAPYVGVGWFRRFGATAQLARAAGEGSDEVQLVAGLHIWF